MVTISGFITGVLLRDGRSGIVIAFTDGPSITGGLQIAFIASVTNRYRIVDVFIGHCSAEHGCFHAIDALNSLCSADLSVNGYASTSYNFRPGH